MINEEMKKRLDELVENLKKTFSSDDGFEEEDGILFTCDTKLDYKINSLLITGGECNWDNMAYVTNAGFRIYAGERDSFGWLSGIIEPKEQKGKIKRIIFG